ncbi:MAG: 3'-5' exonuclease [Spartobacteria bacterium]|nr:3'-5' exonuclease [Spartobacteria bacterium]
MRLSEATLYILDFETTGSVAGYPVEPWQVGLVRFHGGAVDLDDMFSSLLRIGPRPVNPYIPGSFHAHEAALSGAPTLLDLWPSLHHALTRFPLGAHNVATERKMLRQTAAMHQFGPWIDTLVLARLAWPDLASFALDEICNVLELTPYIQQCCPARGPHDALYDAVASAVLLQTLLSQPGWNDLLLEDAVAICKRTCRGR